MPKSLRSLGQGMQTMRNPAITRSAVNRLPAAFCLVALACACGGPALPSAHTAADPIQTDGDKYQLVLENPAVRVLRYHDQPGDKTRLHHHPCFVLYALGPFERRLAFPDGRAHSRSFAAGDVAWMPPQAHTGENIGATPTDALLVELKAPCSG